MVRSQHDHRLPRAVRSRVARCRVSLGVRMTDRDPVPTIPDCPVCESAQHVIRHENEHQGRWLCHGCMLLFDGTSGEWLRRQPTERPDITNEIEQARAALGETAQ